MLFRHAARIQNSKLGRVAAELNSKFGAATRAEGEQNISALSIGNWQLAIGT